LRPKAENEGGLLGEKPVAGAQPRKQTVFYEHENPLKMHTLCINFISFIAEVHTYTRQKGDFGILGGMAPLAPLNPPMVLSVFC